MLLGATRKPAWGQGPATPVYCTKIKGTPIRLAAARSVNALMTAAYWEVGRRIVEFEQGGEGRAGYGEALIKRLGEDLSRRFGRGFGWRNLSQMRAFYLTWPAERILQTLSAKSPPSTILPTPSAISPVKESSALHSAGRGHNLAGISLAVGRAKCASGPPGSLSN